MPELALPNNAAGPNGEPIVTVVAPPNTQLHIPSITYVGRAADVQHVQSVINQQIPAYSILTLAALQSYQLAGARIAIVIQYDNPALPDNDAGLPLWVTRNGVVEQTNNPNMAAAAIYELENSEFVLDPDETYDIVLVIDAQNMFAGYGTSTETLSAARAFYLTVHEVLHPRRGLHTAILNALGSGQTLTPQFILDNDPVYAVQFQAMFNYGVVLRDSTGQLRDPTAAPGSPQYVTLDDYLLLLAQRQADIFNDPTVSPSVSVVGHTDVGLDDVVALQLAEAERAIARRMDEITIAEIENAGQWGRQFASILGNVLPIDDPFERATASALIATIGENIAEAIRAGGVMTALPSGEAFSVLTNVFDEFGANLVSGGVGTISSLLVADLIDSLGLEGTLAGELGQTLGSQYLSAIISNLPGLVSNTTHLSDVLDGVNPAAIVATYIGSKLADEIIQFDTVGGQIGAAIGEGIGAIRAVYVFNALAPINPVLAFVAAIATVIESKIIGGLIGSLFGGTPKAGAAVDWNASAQRFDAERVWSKNGGSKDVVRSMASQVGELLNGVIAASGSRVIDVAGVKAGAYDQKGGDFIYKPSMEGGYAFRTDDMQAVVTHGAFIALHDLSERLAGGDVYVKRALAATLEAANGDPENISNYAAGDFEANTLFGNIATAQDYASYLGNAAVINALIAAEPESAFTAGWTITFARVLELGLDRRWRADWIGGWAAFLDETADGAIDGAAFGPGNVFLELDPESNERLFVFVDEEGALLGVLGDTIDTASKDVILGTTGNDTLTVNDGVIALTSALTLNGEAAEAGDHTIRVAALIDGGAGNDTIRGGDLGNDLLGGEGNDTLIGGALDDWQFGGAGADRLFAGDVANVAFSDTATDATNEAARNAALGVDGGNGDYLDGGEGDDALYGGRGSDWLNGGDGADVLRAGDGGDILDGGAGDDRGSSGEARLMGGAGSDQYVFYYGAGDDVIFDVSSPSVTAGADLYSANTRYAFLGANPGARNWAGDGAYEADGSVVGGEDAISFGAGIGFEDLRLKRGATSGVANADLIIELVDEAGDPTGDTLTILDWFDETRRVEWLRFADGQDIRIADLSSFIVGSALNDTIVGTAGNDWAVGLGGDDDMALLAGDDFGFGGKGADVVAGDGDNDFVSGGDDNDQVMGGAGADTVFGDAGDDTVDGGAGNDIVSGGRGADSMIGGAGNDLYRYWRGDGVDTVFDAYNSSTTQDMKDSSGNWINGYDAESDGTITYNGVVVFDGRDWSVPLDWEPSTGVLRRRVHTSGQNVSANSGTQDTLDFGIGIDLEDVQLRRIGADLALAIAGGAFDASAFGAMSDRIILSEWFSAGAQIERLVFMEVGALSVASWGLGVDASGVTSSDGDDTLSGHTSVDWLTGGLGDDTIAGNNGDDILSGNFGADQLSGGAGADILYGGADDDVIEGGAGADLIFGGAGEDIASYAAVTTSIRVWLDGGAFNTGEAVGDVFNGVEGLEGGSAGDQLYGDDGANLLRGNAGNDFLSGALGDDTYEVNAGEGIETIAEYGIEFTEVVTEAGELLPGYTATWEWIDTDDLFGVTWYYYQLTLTDDDDNVIYESRPHVDFKYSAQTTIPAPSAWPHANGQWQGAGRTGNGVQVVSEAIVGGDGGRDTLVLGEGISLSDLTPYQFGDLALEIAGGGEARISGHFYETGTGVRERAVEELILHDGLAVNLLDPKFTGDSGTSEDDLFLGDDSADTFDGGDGDDVLSGGTGSAVDTLSGGAGDDVLEGGGGGDVLSGGTDSITTDHAALAADPGGAYGDTIRYVTSTAGVLIDLAAQTATGRDTSGTAASVGHASGDTISGIENVVGSWTYGDTLLGSDGANRLAGLGGDDHLDGRGGDDVLIGGAGADELLGGDGDDGVSGEAGDDDIDGGAGDDLISGGDGADLIHAGAGEDSADGGAGDDEIYGEADADRLSGAEGDDALHGGAGDDVLAGGAGEDDLYGGDGADTLGGGEGDDQLEGGAGDDAYVFDGAFGEDVIVDASGASNAIVIAGVSFEEIWLTRSGDDLVIGLIGSDGQITVSGYYASSNASLMRSIATADHTLFLSAAEPLIEAMTTASASPPDAVPTAVSDLFATYWHLGEKSAPQLSDQTLTTDEDVALEGAVDAADHDGEAMIYEVHAGPEHGEVALDDETGVWTYTPDANWSGADDFVIAVTDESDQTTFQDVSVEVEAVNDAPAINVPSLSVNENVANGAVVGSLSATDAEGQAVTFTQTSNAGGRFAISSAGEITVIDGALIDFEAGASYQINVTATDAGGAQTAQAITINLNDINEAPTSISFADTTTSLAESASTATRTKVADLTIVDDALGSLTLGLTGADAASFEIVSGALYLKAGVSLNYEAKSSYAVQVTVDDAAFAGTELTSSVFTLSLTDVNEAPSALSLVNVTDELSEATSTASAVKVADLVVTDDALGSESFVLSGADAAAFEVVGSALYLKAGVALNYETKSSYAVTVGVDDASVGSSPDQTQDFTLSILDGNEPPTGLSFANTTTALNENTSTASRVKVADLVVNDDALGTLTFGVTGADAASFEIDGDELYLKAGVTLNYEAKSSYAVTVTVDDPALGSTYELSEGFSLFLNDVNEAPSAISLTNTTTTIAENTSTASRIKVADIGVTDDALGSETLSLSGTDAASFEIVGSELFLKAGVALNYEAKTSYAATVNVDDSSVGSTPDQSQAFTLSVTDVNEAPTGLSLTNTTTSIAENTSTASRIKVADIVVTDDALGAETFSLTGTDAASFEIIGAELFLKAGVTLNSEAKTSYDVTVNSDDTSVGSTPDHTQAFTLSVTNVNEAPSAVSLTNTTTTIAENTSTASRIKVADIGVTDDALGSETLSLSGTDAASFEIIGSELFLKAGVALNYEAKSSYAVTVNVDDATVGSTPDQSQAFTLSVGDVNEAPTGLSLANTTTSIAENTSTASRVKVADIVVTDDALGTETFSLTGADAASFEIVGSELFIKAGVTLNYEAKTSYAVTVNADDTTVGSTPDRTQAFTLSVTNVNEAPSVSARTRNSTSGGSEGLYVGVSSVADPEGGALTWSIVSVSSTNEGASYSISASTGQLYCQYSTSGWRTRDVVVVSATDSGGLSSQASVTLNYDTDEPWPPIVLDLDGDGVELVSAENTGLEFDVNGDDVLDDTGWVGADDAFLALDRDGDGLITYGDEIAFTHDVDGAASDLEGLVAYDTSGDGFFDAADERFADFRLWQDANQDGVSQTSELTTLVQRGIVAINLTLTLTGQSPENMTDNVLYGTASYIRSDGTTGLVGDVFLAYVPTEPSGGLPPIVFDLDGGGVSLVSRATSTVRFDANDDGSTERTGWFAAGEGVLALDRNSDGFIGSGAEISFVEDVPGARTDLEGLAAYDTNENGFFDEGDARFGEFLIWRDADQDGVSQASELRSLAAWNIRALNLTPTLTGASFEGAQDNVLYATAEFVRTDGSLGLAGDVYLAYGTPKSSADSGADIGLGGVSDGLDNIDRAAKAPKKRQRTRERARDWIDQNEIRFDRDGRTWDAFEPSRWTRREQRPPVNEQPQALSLGKSKHAAAFADFSPQLSEAASGRAASVSSLHRGLAIADQRVLHMINAMAAFAPQDAAELARTSRKRDPRVAEMLTSLPDLR